MTYHRRAFALAAAVAIVAVAWGSSPAHAFVGSSVASNMVVGGSTRSRVLSLSILPPILYELESQASLHRRKPSQLSSSSSPSSRSSALSLSSSSSSSSSVEDEAYSDLEIHEMKELILSLSEVSTDHERRTRVKEVFHEALGRPNGMPKRFTDLFDRLLIETGDQVQAAAKKQLFADQAAEEAANPTTGDTVVVEEEIEEYALPPPSPEKTPQELQLWALVDMMVQTKTIVKKASGDLGTKGNFQ